ncbi:MAG: phosphate/phosphite/phosphonate ABC transporter substrate-binding protein [Candidatus Thiodiazotropha weberae]|nr:phosphate/phosphite/phosphonate ABC transporter substrate-binding protein [Candidatus Thiodiazotropha lotti]MCG7986445.1 phosphate/phosphite/phosphonate ABC transporter substrate-binding protein [Candidatus Thiodiazotropha lotti]MCG8011858.1 phosphate/phosphite/phosphonate ABC transporter substrate-binding protein [Candidatus Thiodiazotropha lotti]MCG8018946.1 phosphate/phosphite/phosphonate ABC transporter substrate-binding protein [Candidatus Thiodiazotropha lotti]MCW4206105.1 phosphate/ph
MKISLFCLLILFVVAPSHAATDQKDTLVLGKISHNPKKHYQYLKPMAKYVIDRMADLGIDKIKIRLAKSKEHLADLLKHGEVDWVTETPIAAAYLHEVAGAEILLRKWKKGVAEYHTVFFSLSGNGIDHLQDLKGKVIALEDPASTSAFYAPASELITQGMKLVRLNSARDKPPADSVGFVFSREEINIATLVHKGVVDAGAFSSDDWIKEDHLPVKYRKDFKIFHRTPDLVRALEIVRQDLEPEIRQRLTEILLDSNDNPAAAHVLRAYQRTMKFDRLSEDQKKSVYNLRIMIKRVDQAVAW